MKTCIYCGQEKAENEFADEHIWPDAVGGDFLPALWRTDDVCGICNSMSGVFVDTLKKADRLVGILRRAEAVAESSAAGLSEKGARLMV